MISITWKSIHSKFTRKLYLKEKTHTVYPSSLKPLTLFRPGFFEPSLTAGGGGGGFGSPLCNLKTVNAMVTKVTQDAVDNISSNFKCLVDMLT